MVEVDEAGGLVETGVLVNGQTGQVGKDVLGVPGRGKGKALITLRFLYIPLAIKANTNEMYMQPKWFYLNRTFFFFFFGSKSYTFWVILKHHVFLSFSNMY